MQYIEQRRREGVCPATVKADVLVLHSLYHYLKESGEVSKNIWHAPLTQLHGVRSGEIRPSRPLTPEQTRSLLNAPDSHTLTGIRDRALLALLFSGFRISEVLAFRASDYRQTASGAHYMVCRKTKSGHMQERAIAPWCAERVEALIAAHRGCAKHGDLDLITHVTGRGLKKTLSVKQVTRGIANEWLKKYASQTGLPTCISCHWGRCTAICHLRDQNFDLSAIRQVSGHASVQMVEYYDRRKRTIEESPGCCLDFGLKDPT
jgi:site-specific recombinase XerD